MNEHRQWLKGELAAWTEENLISPAEAKAIWGRYQEGRGFSWTGPFLTAAAVCLSAGAALTIASFWNGISQETRFYVALLPLLLSLLCAALLLFLDMRRMERPDQPPVPVFAREGVGIFHGAALTAALWMVHDSFLLNDDLFGIAGVAGLFLLVMLYLIRSAGLGIIFAANTAAMAWLSPIEGWPDGAAWVLMALSLPFFFLLVSGKRERGGIAFAWGWMAAVLVLTFYTASERMWQMQFFALAASLTWLVGAVLRKYGWIGMAFRFFGGTAVFGVIWAASFGQYWQAAEGRWFLWLLIGLFLIADGALLLQSWRRREWLSMAAGISPFFMAAAGLCSFWDRSGALSAIVVTILGILLGGAVAVRGLQTRRIWQITAGAVLIAGEGFIRILDSTMTYGQRGLFFLLVGAAAAVLGGMAFYASRPACVIQGKEPRHEEI